MNPDNPSFRADAEERRALEYVETARKFKEALRVLNMHHQWHQEYDEYGGYPDSELEMATTRALAGEDFNRKIGGRKMNNVMLWAFMISLLIGQLWMLDDARDKNRHMLCAIEITHALALKPGSAWDCDPETVALKEIKVNR